MKLDTLPTPLYRLETCPNYPLSELQQKIQMTKIQLRRIQQKIQEGKIPSPTRAKNSRGKKCGIIEVEADKDERDRESKDNK